jgi:hypothetical protein
MRITPIEPEALRGLPRTISMGGTKHVSVYHGTPLEMVRSMASEMGLGTDVHEAVSTLLDALGRNRGVLIAIPEDAPEDVVATLFVYALLDSGVSRAVTAES